MTQVKIGMLTKLPFSTPIDVENFITKLVQENFFSTRQISTYFTMQLGDSWYLDERIRTLDVDFTDTTETISFDSGAVEDELAALENILLNIGIDETLESKTYVFIGEFQPYEEIFTPSVS